MAFVETPRFPDKISYGSGGGPMYSTDIVTVKSGHETRNQNWTQSRHKYDAAFGVTSEPRLSELIEYFHAMAGSMHEFRFKDWGDFKSCALNLQPSDLDQSIGTGDGTNGTDGTATFQLIKTYASGLSTIRPINKPVAGTVLIAVDGVSKVETTDFTVDTATGIVTFVSGSIPLAGEAITAGYEFDVPCRFGSDELNINYNAYSVGEATVPIIEVRI